MRQYTHIGRTFISGLCVCAVLLGAWSLSAVDQPKSNGTIVSVRADDASRSVVDGPLRRRFGVFRSDAEALPSAVARAISQKPIPGARWDLTQKLLVGGPRSLWAAPARDGVCLVERTQEGLVAVTCTSLSGAISRGVWTASIGNQPHGGDRVNLLGMAPDGIVRVKFQTHSHGSIAVPVKRNVFAARLAGTELPEKTILIPRRRMLSRESGRL